MGPELELGVCIAARIAAVAADVSLGVDGVGVVVAAAGGGVTTFTLHLPDSKVYLSAHAETLHFLAESSAYFEAFVTFSVVLGTQESPGFLNVVVCV
jgi:hypothetical protein